MGKHVEVERKRDITVVTITDSQLDEYNQSHELRDEIVGALQESDVPKLVIDMRHVEYLTSVVMLPFVGISKVASDLGGHVVLCNLSDVVATVLTVSELLVTKRTAAHHLQLAADLDSAITVLEQGDPA